MGSGLLAQADDVVPAFVRSPSYPQLRIGRNGMVIGSFGKPLKPITDKSGHLRINVWDKVRKTTKQLGVHVLVCEAFHGAKPDGNHHAAHRNGNPADNRAENLRWATPQRNEWDKLDHDRVAWGERNGCHKLTDDEVLEIRRRRQLGARLAPLAREFSVSEATISSICLRKTWRHL